MRRTTTALAIVIALTAATPTLAQESPGFGALVGGLVGGAIDAAASGRRPRGGDLVPGGAGRSGEKGGRAGGHASGEGGGHPGGAQAGAGQHRQAQAGGEHRAPQGGAGQAHRKPGK